MPAGTVATEADIRAIQPWSSPKSPEWVLSIFLEAWSGSAVAANAGLVFLHFR